MFSLVIKLAFKIRTALNEVLNLNNLFSAWNTYYNSETKDLFFVGIKKGSSNLNILEKYVNNYVTNTSLNIVYK